MGSHMIVSLSHVFAQSLPPYLGKEIEV